jgi:hypothetical protein
MIGKLKTAAAINENNNVTVKTCLRRFVMAYLVGGAWGLLVFVPSLERARRLRVANFFLARIFLTRAAYALFPLEESRYDAGHAGDASSNRRHSRHRR